MRAGFNTDGLCIVTNVSSEPRHIKIEMVNFNNGDIIAAFESADPSFPGMGRSIGPPYSAGAAYCRFTVLDGTREDIRGSLTIVNTPEGGSKIVVPAE